MPCRTVESEIIELVGSVMSEYHPDLMEAGVTIKTLWAYARRDKNGMPKGPALKLHGYPALATIKVNSEDDRIQGKTDLTLKIDLDNWPELDGEERVALLDHELEHAVLIRDKDGQIELDNCNRPRIKLRPHDYQLGGFFNVLQRHKQRSLEAKYYGDLHRQMSQRTFFDWS